MIKRIQQELQRLAELKSLRELHVRNSHKPGKITFKDKKLIDFTSWDFLNLNSEKKFILAFQKEAHESGVGAMASRSSSGTLPAHFSLEKRISHFLTTESALLFSSSNQVVLSLVSALLGEGDCVIVDEQLHSRVIDAAFLVNAEAIPFDTSNPDTLAKAIKLSQPYKTKLIFCEAVNPITGELLDLKAVTTLTEQDQIPFVLDESYALGTVGLRGAGIMDGLPAPANLLCRYGSLSYGIGAYGAFLAGPKYLTDYLINRSRTFVTECAMPPALSAAIETGLNIIELEHGKRDHLRRLSTKLRNSFRLSGIPINDQGETPIMSINFATKQTAQEVYEALFTRGYLVEVISPGFLLDSGGSLRILINSAHTEKDIDEFFTVFFDIFKRAIK